jgi:hypothetical protein
MDTVKAVTGSDDARKIKRYSIIKQQRPEELIRWLMTFVSS